MAPVGNTYTRKFFEAVSSSLQLEFSVAPIFSAMITKNWACVMHITANSIKCWDLQKSTPFLNKGDDDISWSQKYFTALPDYHEWLTKLAVAIQGIMRHLVTVWLLESYFRAAAKHSNRIKHICSSKKPVLSSVLRSEYKIWTGAILRSM